MQRRGRAFGAVLVDETQADADQQDDADDDRLRAVAEEERQHGGGRQQAQHGVVQLTHQDRGGADPVRANGIRARTLASRACASVLDSPSAEVSSERQHVGERRRSDVLVARYRRRESR